MELSVNGTAGSRLEESGTNMMTSSDAPEMITEMITRTLGNLSSYDPGFGNSTTNTTHIPHYEPANWEIKRIIVILTNIIVFLSIVFTCFLAFNHKQWERRMRREQEEKENKTETFDYDLVNIDEEDEDEEIFVH